MRAKRGSAVEKTEISPIGAQALTTAKTTIGDHHPQTPILPSSFSTDLEIAQSVSEVDETATLADDIAS